MTLYALTTLATTPFIHDVPAAEALAAWRDACAAAGCPERVEAVACRLAEAVGRVTAEPVWATRSSPPYDAAAMDGIAVRAADTVGRERDAPAACSTPRRYDGRRHRRPAARRAATPWSCASTSTRRRRGGRAARGRGPPYQHVRSIGEDVSAAELLLPEGHRLRPVDVAAAAAAGATELRVRRRPVVAVLPTGDEIRPIGTEPRRGRDPRHQLADARRPGRGGGLRGAALADRARRSRADRRGGARRGRRRATS